MDTFAPPHATNARRLSREDLDAVVGIDARLEGHTRRTYFERRLAAAVREPDLHIQVAIDDDDGDRITGIVENAMDHGGLLRHAAHAAR